MIKNPVRCSRLAMWPPILGVPVLLLIGMALSPAPAQSNTTAVVAAAPASTSPVTAAAAVTPTLPSALRIVEKEFVTLDPALSADADSARIIAEVFSGLVTLDRDLNVVPDIAQRWSVSGDHTIYTFTLRAGVRFHDGRTVTAQDFKYSFERAADPRTQSSTASMYLGDIVGVNAKLNGKSAAVDGVRVIDDHTLEIRIDAPQTAFLPKLSLPNAFVVDRNNIERDGTAWTRKPNGTGPFKFKEYVPKQRLVLIRNDDYYLEPKPQIAQVELTLAAPGALYAASYSRAYAAGELDAYRISPSSVVTVSNPANPSNKELVSASILSTSFIFLNTLKPPFDDPKVRQAFAMAIDRQKLAGDQTTGQPLLAKSILPPGMPGYSAALADPEFDPARAKQLLAQSRYAGQLPSVIWYTMSASPWTRAIADMLNVNAGITVAIKQVDAGTFYKTAATNQNPYQMVDYGWTADYPDPENFIALLFRTNSMANSSGYTNPKVDKLIDQAAPETDPDERRRLYQQAEREILEDLPAIPFYHDRDFWLVKPYVKGLSFPPAVAPRLRHVSLAW